MSVKMIYCLNVLSHFLNACSLLISPLNNIIVILNNEILLNEQNTIKNTNKYLTKNYFITCNESDVK